MSRTPDSSTIARRSVTIGGELGKTSTRVLLEAILADAMTDPAVSAGPITVLLSADPTIDSLATAAAADAAELHGPAILACSADHAVTAQAAAAAPDTVRVVTFGLSAGDLRAEGVDAGIDGTSFTLIAGAERHRVTLKLLGEHQVTNALAALAAASAAGIPLTQAIDRVQTVTDVDRWHMQRRQRPDGLVLINDAAGSHPRAAAEALKTLALLTGLEPGDRRSVAVLGALSVPAADAFDAHDRLGRLVVRLNVRQLVVVGQAARHIHNAAGLEGSWDGESVLVDTAEQAYDFLMPRLTPTDLVLIGSGHETLGPLGDRLAGAPA